MSWAASPVIGTGRKLMTVAADTWAANSPSLVTKLDGRCGARGSDTRDASHHATNDAAPPFALK